VTRVQITAIGVQIMKISEWEYRGEWLSSDNVAARSPGTLLFPAERGGGSGGCVRVISAKTRVVRVHIKASRVLKYENMGIQNMEI
jgi:hypothetical protein